MDMCNQRSTVLYWGALYRWRKNKRSWSRVLLIDIRQRATVMLKSKKHNINDRRTFCTIVVACIVST